jgi:hypothetical protein
VARSHCRDVFDLRIIGLPLCFSRQASSAKRSSALRRPKLGPEPTRNLAQSPVDLRGYGLANLAALQPFMSQVYTLDGPFLRPDTIITLGADILTLTNIIKETLLTISCSRE